MARPRVSLHWQRISAITASRWLVWEVCCSRSRVQLILVEVSSFSRPRMDYRIPSWLWNPRVGPAFIKRESSSAREAVHQVLTQTAAVGVGPDRISTSFHPHRTEPLIPVPVRLTARMASLTLGQRGRSERKAAVLLIRSTQAASTQCLATVQFISSTSR